MIATLALLATQGLTTLGALTPPQESVRVEYVARFQVAITAYDAGRYELAESLFRRAGELVPEATVWRVHAAASLAARGDLVEAREAARAALRRGYPLSDLAAIDARLLPDAPIEADLALGETTVVARLGNVGVIDHGDVAIVGDLAILHGTAWDLMTGEVLATQRTGDTRVVGKVTYADGRQEDVDFAVEPGRWDHVDGRLLEAPTSERDGEGMRLPDSIRTLTSTQRRRGLRTGFWGHGAEEHADPRFLTGGELSLSKSPFWNQSQGPTQSTLVNLDTLQTRTAPGDPWLDASRVDEADLHAALSEILGGPWETLDSAYRFDGLPQVVVARHSHWHGERAPLVIVDLALGEIVASPKVAPDAFIGVDLGSIAYAQSAGIMFASNRSGGTLEAISTETWSVVWREPWQSGQWARRITCRGDRVYSWATSPEQADVHDIRSGEVLYEGTTSLVSAIDGSDDGRWVVGASADSCSLLDGRDFSHVLTMWLEGNDHPTPPLAAIGVDGTFSAPEARILEAHVWFAGQFVPAVDVAPWLWDPLHVRSLRADGDRRLRRLPAEL